MATTPTRILRAIADRDPDAGMRAPSESERRNFTQFIITNYGEQALRDYYHTNWDQEQS